MHKLKLSFLVFASSAALLAQTDSVPAGTNGGGKGAAIGAATGAGAGVVGTPDDGFTRDGRHYHRSSRP